MESITSLLIKLNTQISEATSANRPISQLENDLIKETLRKMYDMIGNTNTVTNIQAPQEQQIIREEKSPAIGFATMVQETMKHQLKEEPKIIAPPIHQETIPTPVVATTTPRVMETIASPAMETASAPEEVTILKAAPVAVTEIPMEIEVVIPEPATAPAPPPAAAPRPAIEEKVIAARTQQIKAASLFEEQSTVASKYSAQETIGQKINRDQPVKTLSDALQHTHLADLKLSIGINERFAFINELFSGDQQLYHQSIEHLNSLQVYEDARKLLHEELKQQLGWQTGSERFRQFDELVKRRFHA
ncbi:MAG: hypothetical protein KBB64_06740 [Bacteroidia bacterium]|nr:hypothetical protein [Bacteroidia bacterium]